MATNNAFIVLTNPTEGNEDAYNDWYDNVHLDEVTEIPGFVSARRYKYSGPQLDGFDNGEHRYLAIYWIDDDPATAFANLAGKIGDGSIVLPEVLDGETTKCWNFTAIGEEVSAS